ARQHFEDGSRLYDLGKFREAAREYEEAYKYKPDPALLFNIGQAYRGAGNTSEALTAYKSYLRKVPEAPNRAEVEGHIGRLQQTLDDERRARAAEELRQRQQQQQQQAIAQPQLVVTPPPPAEHRPLYEKWWLWTAVGGALVVGGAIAIAVAETTPKNAASPPNTFGVSLH
ncbi:MAG TPA: tetratricopeptide repeat protein, partial [Polyangia bacterium]